WDRVKIWDRVWPTNTGRCWWAVPRLLAEHNIEIVTKRLHDDLDPQSLRSFAFGLGLRIATSN
ncbi:hypothetical protein ACN38_g9273, partial [Penicillium nordicum]